MSNKFHFDQVIKDFEKVKRELPRELAVDSQNFFQESFRKQGWDDNGVQEWKTPQRRIPGTRTYRYPKTRDLGRRTRAILVKSGALRRDIRIRSVSFHRTVISTSLPYAQRHNEGLNGMPKRKFMGVSRKLEGQHLDKIKKRVNGIWK